MPPRDIDGNVSSLTLSIKTSREVDISVVCAIQLDYTLLRRDAFE